MPARPLAVAALSVVSALLAADGGLLASFGASDVKGSAFITSISFGIYLTARLAGPPLRDRSREGRRSRPDHAHLPRPGQSAPVPAAPPESGAPQEAGRRVPSRLGWPCGTAVRREAGSQHRPAPRGEA